MKKKVPDCRGNGKTIELEEKQDLPQKWSYTYIVQCGDGTLYTGWTNDLERRMESHNTGKGAKYTRTRLPIRLVHYEMFSTKQEAMKREYAIKQLTRKDKLLIIEGQKKSVRNRCNRIAEKTVFKNRSDEAYNGKKI